MRNSLGTFEEMVLMIIFRMAGEAYGVPIHQQLEEVTGRTVAMGSIYTTLERLEKKGYISSRWGEATAERGGRKKRFYRLDAAGQLALESVNNSRKAIGAGPAIGRVVEGGAT